MTIPDWDLMVNAFNERMNYHRGEVAKNLATLSFKYPILTPHLDARAREHDMTKYGEGEYFPYVLLTWNYLTGGDYVIPKCYLKKTHAATFLHCKNNKHHPEHWDKELKTNPISFEDRDKPSGILVDAKSMDRISIMEMICDWVAVSDEKNTDLDKWCRENIGVRWDFTLEQQELIEQTISDLEV